MKYEDLSKPYKENLQVSVVEAAKAAGAWHRKVAQNLVTRKTSRKNIVDFFTGLPMSHPYWRKVAPQYFTAPEIAILKKGNKAQIRATVNNANWRMQNEETARYGKKGNRQFGETMITVPAPAGKGFAYQTGTLSNAIGFAVVPTSRDGALYKFGLTVRKQMVGERTATQTIFARHEVGSGKYPKRPVLHPALEKGIQKNINGIELAKAYKRQFKQR